ncbi:hypothetical protein QYF61_017531 [Mycteria americana]|uniref:Uncharacterized protein n=1 Tax=Mycteria americana TaxID=33587 RepID=A0AAN7PJB9_MYCAM|nr:hypothetical protein QYF61_017531 [Mycteria americana]
MRVAQSHRTLMRDLEMASRSAGLLPMPCCSLSCTPAHPTLRDWEGLAECPAHEAGPLWCGSSLQLGSCECKRVKPRLFDSASESRPELQHLKGLALPPPLLQLLALLPAPLGLRDKSLTQYSRWGLTRAEEENHLPQPAGHASCYAAQDMVGLLGYEHTLLAHVQLFIHQYPQVLLCRAALDHIIPQPVLILGVALTQVQDLALGLVEAHEVHMGPLLKLVQVPVDGIPSLRCVNSTTQLGVICKLAEGALDPTVYVIDEDVKQ